MVELNRSAPPTSLKTFGFHQLLLISAVTLILPSFGIREQRVFFMRTVMKIQTPKSDPPRIAFLDIMKSREPMSQVAPPTTIDLAKVIAEKKLHPVEQSFRYRRVALPEMTIQPMTYLYNKSTETYEEDWTHKLTEREREWLQTSGVRQEDMDFSKIEDPLQKSLREKVQREIQNVRSTVPGGWVISGSSDRGSLSKASAVPTTVARDISPADVRNPSDLGEDPQPQKKRAYQGNFRVSGHLTLDARTPFLPGDHFEVHWMRESISRKSGEFFPHKEWTYQIDVTELIGIVRVDLYDAYGALKAIGEYQLSPDHTPQQFQNAVIQLRPARQQVSNYRSFYPGKRNWDKGIVKAKAAIDDQTEFYPERDGKLTLDGVAPRSSSFVYSEGKEFYPAIHVVQTGEIKQLTMLPRRWVKALQQVVADQRNLTPIEPSNGALVMGQAVAGGKALAGVRIEIAEAPGFKPVYLNSWYWPDPSLQATSENGYFVIMDLPLGYYSIQGFLGAQFFGFGNVLSEPEAFSQLEVEGHLSKAPFEVRAFDAFNSEEQLGQLHLQALGQQVIDVQGYAVLDVPRSSQLMLAWFEPDEKNYVSGIYVVPPGQDYLHIPMVRHEWIHRLMRQSGLNLIPERGNVIGFVRKGNYSLDMPHVDAQAGAKVIFFSSSGEMTEGPVAEGGFLIVNVPPSGQTVVIGHQDGETVSQVIPVDANQTTIVRFLP